MFKKILIVSIFTSFFVFTPKAFGQSLSFDRAYQDYQYNLSLYQSSYSAYQDARDFYQKNQTLSLKEDARKKTLTLLRQRDELIIVYLSAIRAKINETEGLTDGDKNDIFGKIDPEATWYQSHKNRYNDEDSLDTLFSEGAGASDRYAATTSPIIYQSLFTISYGQMVNLRQEHEKIYTDVKSQVTNPDPYNHWFSDIDSTIETLKTDEGKSKDQIKTIYTNSYSPVSAYNSAIAALSQSLTPIAQLNRFLTEVETAIKNQQ